MIDLNDVLLAMSNISVDDPIAEIWGRGLQSGYKIIEYTGALPITINANGDALLDYRIYGGDGGVGETTENLWNPNTAEKKRINYDGRIVNDNSHAMNAIPVEPGLRYYFYSLKEVHDSATYWQYRDGNDEIVGDLRNGRALQRAKFTPPENVTKVIICFGKAFEDNIIRDFGVYQVKSEPSNYIPYGYKLPMTVYKQEFVVTSDMLDQSNWVLSGYWFMYFDISDFISKEECDVKIYQNFADGYTPKLLVVGITDKQYSMLDDSYRILKNNGEILNKKFDFSSWNKVYLCIGYGNGFDSTDTKQSKIDELFENWKILIAPTSQTRESPVYIGDTPLGEDEYVSYSDGKIYRMSDGTLTPTDPPVPFPEIPTIDGETVIDYDGNPKPSQMYVKYKGKG